MANTALTPLGEHLRRLRLDRGITQKEMAQGIGVSAAYLSALEHGKRGTPSWPMLQRIIGYLNVIWDDAETLRTLADLSDPRVVIDTSDLSARATFAANLAARKIPDMTGETLERLIKVLEER